MQQKCNVVMIATKGIANIMLDSNNKLFIHPNDSHIFWRDYTYQYLYITNDEEVNNKDQVIVTVKDDTRIKYLTNIIVKETNQIYCKGDTKYSFSILYLKKSNCYNRYFIR